MFLLTLEFTEVEESVSKRRPGSELVLRMEGPHRHHCRQYRQTFAVLHPTPVRSQFFPTTEENVWQVPAMTLRLVDKLQPAEDGLHRNGLFFLSFPHVYVLF